jgi:hypothetical protein
MLWVPVEFVRVIDSDGFPEVVEISITDVDGAVWRFVDKRPVFFVSDEAAQGRLGCDRPTAAEHAPDPGIEIVVSRWTESIDGQTIFRVRAEQIAEDDRP